MSNKRRDDWQFWFAMVGMAMFALTYTWMAMHAHN